MSRDPRPWYSSEKRCYMAHVKRRKVRLLKGEQSPENEKLAAKKLKQVLKGTTHETAGALRVADVIERYLKLHQAKYAERAFTERVRILQQFADTHGYRKVNDRDCLPVHVEEWMADHPE